MAAYRELLPELLDVAPGCLDVVALRAVRDTLIDLCKRASVWQHDVAADFDAFPPYPADSDDPFWRVGFNHSSFGTIPSLVHRVVWLSIDDELLEGMTTQQITNRRRFELSANFPEVFAFDSPDALDGETDRGAVLIYPPPGGSDTITLEARLVLKPAVADMEIANGQLLEEYHELIVNGSIAKLLGRPSKPWSDLRAAVYYKEQYEEGLNSARVRSAGGSGRSPVTRYNDGLGTTSTTVGEGSFFPFYSRTRRRVI